MSDPFPFKDYINSLDRKIIGVAILIRDHQKKILIVKPTYREGWLLPGGSVEKFESPYQAGIRETLEEIGLPVSIKRFLVADYVKTIKQGIEYDSIQFVFDGGVISKEDIMKIKLPIDELNEHRFVTVTELGNFLNENHCPRIVLAVDALENKKTYFLENGIRVV